MQDKPVDYLIESLLVVSLVIVDVVSLIILVESEELLVVETLSIIVDVVDSVLVLEQAVAKAIIESRKKADFTMFTRS